MVAVPRSRTEMRRCEAKDLPRVAWLKDEAFRSPLDSEHWTSRGRVAVVDGTVQAAVRAGTGAQFYGGRRVEIGIIDTLMVAPEARGAGVGSALMLELLREFQARKLSMVTNYATTIPFYRRLGWEVAGSRTVYRAPRGRPPSGDGPPPCPWGPADLPGVAACYDGFARSGAGLLERSHDWWREWVLYEPDRQPVFRYLIRSGADVTGYVIYTQVAEPSRLGAYSIECRELVWTDRRSLDALLRLLWGQGSLLRNVSWPGPPDEPLLMHFEQSQMSVAWPYSWLVRLTDPIRAFESRGYPRGAAGGFALGIVDPVLAGGTRFVEIEIADGRAHARPTARARMTVDVGALGAIYTGWLSPRAAARLGRLQEATPREIEALESAFAGPRPWIVETF